MTDRLDRQWSRLRHDRRALAHAESWRLPLPSSAPLTDLADIVTATARGRCAGDAILARLVTLSRTDELAGIVLLRRVLPGLLDHCRRYGWAADGDPVDAVVSAAWVAIGDYDVERRPRFIAPAIVSSASFRAFRQASRLRSSSERVVDTTVLSATMSAADDEAAAAELDAALREAAIAGVPADDLRLVRELVLCDSPLEVAERHAVSTRTIRNRRHAAVDRIRAAVVAA